MIKKYYWEARCTDCDSVLLVTNKRYIDGTYAEKAIFSPTSELDKSTFHDGCRIRCKCGGYVMYFNRVRK